MTYWDVNQSFREDLVSFNANLHESFIQEDDENYVISGFGVWLLFAVGVGATSERLSNSQQKRAEAFLGMPAAQAVSYAQNLLKTAPAGLNAASAAWFDPSYQTADGNIARWVEELTASQTGEVTYRIPNQEELDSWAAENTNDIIKSFPLQVDETVKVILANAVALQAAWKDEFETAVGVENHWGVQSILHSPDGKHHKQFFKDTETDELFYLIENISDSGIRVDAVIAFNPELTEAETMNVAEAYIAGSERFQRVDGASLPNSSDFYEVEEFEGTSDKHEAYLPAWSAEATHKFRDSVFLEEGLNLLGSVVDDSQLSLDAAQTAAARYTKDKFEAAAVTATMFAGAAMPTISKRKKFIVQFNRPFAVVAAVTGPRNPEWHGVPLFTAWVVKADEA